MIVLWISEIVRMAKQSWIWLHKRTCQTTHLILHTARGYAIPTYVPIGERTASCTFKVCGHWVQPRHRFAVYAGHNVGVA